MDTQAQATKYLTEILEGICAQKVMVHCDSQDVGLAYTLIPTVADDYRILIGFKGKNTSLLRNLMKLWRNKNAPNLSIHVWTPNPRMLNNNT